MLLSKYNKFIFSIFSENKNYLIITVYALKFRTNYVAYLQIQYTRTDSTGRYLPAFSTKTRLQVIDCSDWDIIFSDGKIIFKEDSIKVEFSSGLVMVYLTFTWDKNAQSPLTLLGKDLTDNESVTWSSFDFQSFVKGNFISPLTSTEFNNASGNIDLIKTGNLPFRVPVSGFLWSRLHHKDINLSYSFVFNKTKKSDSRLLFLLDNKLVEFTDVDYQLKKDKLCKRLSIRYPDNIVLNAENSDYKVSVNVYDHLETSFIESFNHIDFMGKLFAGMFMYYSGFPKELYLLAKADVTINSRINQHQFSGISLVSSYISFTR